MRGEDLRVCRERKDASQADFAAWLNDRLGRRYDKQRVSRWEVGAEKIPVAVADLVSAELRVLASTHGPGITIIAANQKGGVAKTATCVNTATLLARRGYRVLLIDSDPQANATMHLGIDPLQAEKDGKSLRDVFEDRATMRDIIHVVPSSGLEVVAASPMLSVVEGALATDSTSGLILRSHLVDLKREYDFIIIDCPPNLGPMTQNGVVAADALIIPCQTEMLAIAGVGLLMMTVDKHRRRSNPHLRIIGILPTMYQSGLQQHQIGMEAIEQQYGKSYRIFPAVPRATAYGDAVMNGRAAVDMPGLRGLAALETVADAFIEERKTILGAVHVNV
ncbi:AAA family ATPase [Azospirillum sp. TSO35-2]|uniref:ParA family protein n=1 Tax=Azospirillum sp. TSO35-2 TaxID=716796 RepID=UPI000D61495B|nr:AAA family ATPase [Azospirillum sp. TSO35-2]PWC35936.1 hypothetical protein TSO352_12025 [Azospirillum sp. TSO35-2]